MVKDNGPQFSLCEIENFADICGFEHKISSPKHPQGCNSQSIAPTPRLDENRSRLSMPSYQRKWSVSKHISSYDVGHVNCCLQCGLTLRVQPGTVKAGSNGNIIVEPIDCTKVWIVTNVYMLSEQT
ncbi:hypothetical protein PoB_006008200 [Plakobranchus ocellatus]|uniref:Integrase catalytic domain-containing protein n=1 Tax=Plakobranchus ocellatus TaxID=259542 RepID=A0AAV4CNY8_9GAST|nr:hypothetical protein PoB_006008200 [Plakobranchus ocellatus]